jgi:hypothetical protein
MALPFNFPLKSVYNLPNPSIITEPAKIADIITLSSRRICGEDDLGGHI